MATARARVGGRTWLERARVAALAERILEVDRLLLRHGEAALTREEAEVLHALASRLAA
jgi:hypothetical protein